MFNKVVAIRSLKNLDEDKAAIGTVFKQVMDTLISSPNAYDDVSDPELQKLITFAKAEIAGRRLYLTLTEIGRAHV